eukprot:TRINITY_DN9978_c0_g1_i5.p1 TRINITY_DN9978_c0_g1~~TRINITY_DN9978_c0_g1_i5.p1  ORF type:complete len:1641 (+),score=456.73 TRINITY_DN9978_c0_g1_i5:51-4925(+)
MHSGSVLLSQLQLSGDEQLLDAEGQPPPRRLSTKALRGSVVGAAKRVRRSVVSFSGIPSVPSADGSAEDPGTRRQSRAASLGRIPTVDSVNVPAVAALRSPPAATNPPQPPAAASPISSAASPAPSPPRARRVSIAAVARRVSIVTGSEAAPMSPTSVPAGTGPLSPRLHFHQTVALTTHAEAVRRREQLLVDGGDDPWPWARQRDKEMWFADGLHASPTARRRRASVGAGSPRPEGQQQRRGSAPASPSARAKPKPAAPPAPRIVGPSDGVMPQRGDTVALRRPRWKEALSLLRRQREAAVRHTQGFMAVGAVAAARVHRFVKWVRGRTLQRRYERLRDEYDEVMRAGGCVTSVDDDGTVSYRRQANPAMNTPEMLMKRIQLRDHQGIKDSIRHLWVRMPRCPDPHADKIDRQIYQWMSLKMLGLFAETNKEKIAAIQHVDQDWFQESNGEYLMDYTTFFDCMFSLLDVWVESLQPDDYVALMHRITARCASRIDFFWSLKLAERHWEEWLEHTGHAKEGWWTPEQSRRVPTTLSPEHFPFGRPKTFVSLKSRAAQVWSPPGQTTGPPPSAGRRRLASLAPVDTDSSGPPSTTAAGTAPGAAPGTAPSNPLEPPALPPRRASSRWRAGSTAAAALISSRAARGGAASPPSTVRKAKSGYASALRIYKKVADDSASEASPRSAREDAAAGEKSATHRRMSAGGWREASAGDVAAGVVGRHRVRDAQGQWWPCMVRGRSADGTYVVRVYDSGTVVDGEEGAYWPRVELRSIQVCTDTDSPQPQLLPPTPGNRIGRPVPPSPPPPEEPVRRAPPPGPAAAPVVGCAAAAPPPTAEEVARSHYLRTAPTPVLLQTPDDYDDADNEHVDVTEARRVVLTLSFDDAAARFPLLGSALRNASEYTQRQFRAAWDSPQSLPTAALRALTAAGAFVAPPASSGPVDADAAAGAASGRGWEGRDSRSMWWPVNVLTFVPRRGAYVVEVDDGRQRSTRWDAVAPAHLRRAAEPTPAAVVQQLLAAPGRLEGRDGRGVWWPVTATAAFSTSSGQWMYQCTVADGHDTVWDKVPLCALRLAQMLSMPPPPGVGAKWSHECRDADGEWWLATVQGPFDPSRGVVTAVDVLCGGEVADRWADVPLCCIRNRVASDSVAPNPISKVPRALLTPQPAALVVDTGAPQLTPLDLVSGLRKRSIVLRSGGRRRSSDAATAAADHHPSRRGTVTTVGPCRAAAGAYSGSIADFHVPRTDIVSGRTPRRAVSGRRSPSLRRRRTLADDSFAWQVVGLDLAAGDEGWAADGSNAADACRSIANVGCTAVRALLLHGVGLSDGCLKMLVAAAVDFLPSLQVLDLRSNSDLTADAVVPVLQLSQALPDLQLVRADATRLRQSPDGWRSVQTGCMLNVAKRLRMPEHVAALHSCAPVRVVSDDVGRRRPRWNRTQERVPLGVPHAECCDLLRRLANTGGLADGPSLAGSLADAWHGAAIRALARRALGRLERQKRRAGEVTAAYVEACATASVPPDGAAPEQEPASPLAQKRQLVRTPPHVAAFRSAIAAAAVAFERCGCLAEGLDSVTDVAVPLQSTLLHASNAGSRAEFGGILSACRAYGIHPQDLLSFNDVAALAAIWATSEQQC